MRALRTFAISASVFLLPLSAHANFETTGVSPSSTLPAFQSQATASGVTTSSVSNPANYYGAQVASAAPTNIQPSYAMPQPFSKPQYAIAPLTNGSDPGVGPVVIEGNNVKPVVIEGQKAPEFKQVGYGYAPVTTDAATAQATLSAAPIQQPVTNTGYATSGYGAYATQPATYATTGQASAYAPAPATQQYQQQPYGNAPASSAGYGLSGYAPSYTSPQPQTSPGMLGSVGAPQPYQQQAYAQQAAAPQGYGQQPSYGNAPAASAYASQGAYGSAPAPVASAPTPSVYGSTYTSTYATPNADPTQGYSSNYTTPAYAAPVAPAPTAPAYPNYGTNSGAYGSGYGSQFNATPTPQAPYGYNGAYGGQQAAAPQPQYQQQAPQYQQPQPMMQQPDYSQQPQQGGYGNYAPYAAPQPPAQTYDTATPAPRYSTMDYQPGKQRSSMYNNDSVSMAAVPAAGRPYLALRTGLNFAQDSSFTDLTAHFNTSYHTGWELGGAAGYEFPSLFGSFLLPRAELEVNALMNSVEEHNVGGVQVKDPNAFGQTDTIRVFANGYFDIDTPLRRWFTPYIGGGVGIGFVDYDRHGTTPSGVDISDSDTGMAYNIGGGFSFPIMSRGTSVDIGYRFSQVLGLEFTALDGSKSKTDVGGHEVTFSLRQRF